LRYEGDLPKQEARYTESEITQNDQLIAKAIGTWTIYKKREEKANQSKQG
jgi:hypothetical protein